MKKFFIEMKTNINPDIFYETDLILRKNQSLYFFLRIFLFATSFSNRLWKTSRQFHIFGGKKG